MFQSHRKAFTMLELTFVIVIIGILSAVAVPKLAATRNDALVSRGRATVSALRSAIATERQKQILQGSFTDINGSTAAGLLDYGMGSGWSQSGDTFTFTGPSGNTCAFTVTGNKLTKGACSVSGMSDL
jgi:general secretion pathway protein G